MSRATKARGSATAAERKAVDEFIQQLDAWWVGTDRYQDPEEVFAIVDELARWVDEELPVLLAYNVPRLRQLVLDAFRRLRTEESSEDLPDIVESFLALRQALLADREGAAMEALEDLLRLPFERAAQREEPLEPLRQLARETLVTINHLVTPRQLADAISDVEQDLVSG